MSEKPKAVNAIPMPLYLADDELEYWGRSYLAMPHLGRHGVSFETFLSVTPQVREDSTRLIQLCVRFRLDEQAREVAERARLQGEARQRALAGTRDIEKLRHRRWPRGRSAFWRSASA